MWAYDLPWGLKKKLFKHTTLQEINIWFGNFVKSYSTALRDPGCSKNKQLILFQTKTCLFVCLYPLLYQQDIILAQIRKQKQMGKSNFTNLDPCRALFGPKMKSCPVSLKITKPDGHNILMPHGFVPREVRHPREPPDRCYLIRLVQYSRRVYCLGYWFILFWLALRVLCSFHKASPCVRFDGCGSQRMELSDFNLI